MEQTDTASCKHMHAWARYHSLSLSLSLSCAHSHSRAHTHTYTLTRSCTLTHTLSCAHSHSRAHSHTYIHTHTHSRTHSLSHTHARARAHTHTHTRMCMMSSYINFHLMIMLESKMRCQIMMCMNTSTYTTQTTKMFIYMSDQIFKLLKISFHKLHFTLKVLSTAKSLHFIFSTEIIFTNIY
jgi:hypothetical protein